MNTLPQHIKTLLLTHDHVSLPQFGTFFADTVKASCEDGVFIPMQRELQFTSEIDDTDDSLLRSIASAGRLTMEQAQHRLDKAIEEAGRTLACTGTLDFDTLGTFSFSGGRITFEKCKQSLVVPSLYGLDTIRMPQLPALADDTQNQKAENYVIRLSRRAVHTAACVAATILMLFLWGAPAGDIQRETPQQTDMSSMFIPHINRPDLEALTAPAYLCDPTAVTAQEETATVTEDVVEEEPATMVAEKAVVVEEKTSEVAVAVDNEKPYTLVLASSVTQKGAECYVELLRKAGCSEARVMTRGRMTRVVYSGYNTHDEAAQAREQMRAQCSDFAEAWILKL